MTDPTSVTISLTPSLTIDTLDALRAHLLESLQPGTTRLELDASEVERVDAAGIQLLLAAQVEMRQRGGQYQLLACSPELVDACDVLGVHEVLIGQFAGSQA